MFDHHKTTLDAGATGLAENRYIVLCCQGFYKGSCHELQKT